MIGKELSPILVEIENAILEFDVNTKLKPEYTIEGFRAALYIFSSVMMDKMWELQTNENIDMNDRSNMAGKFGNDLRELIKVYTNIDTYDLYK